MQLQILKFLYASFQVLNTIVLLNKVVELGILRMSVIVGDRFLNFFFFIFNLTKVICLPLIASSANLLSRFALLLFFIVSSKQKLKPPYFLLHLLLSQIFFHLFLVFSDIHLELWRDLFFNALLKLKKIHQSYHHRQILKVSKLRKHFIYYCYKTLNEGTVVQKNYYEHLLRQS